jgi:hypothetical protein
MTVNPPRAAARAPVSMVSESSWPGLPQMAMQIDEPRSNNQAGGVEYFGAIRREFGAGAHNFFAIDQNIQGAFGAAGGIDDAPVLNQKHAIPLLGAVRPLPAH